MLRTGFGSVKKQAYFNESFYKVLKNKILLRKKIFFNSWRFSKTKKHNDYLKVIEIFPLHDVTNAMPSNENTCNHSKDNSSSLILEDLATHDLRSKALRIICKQTRLVFAMKTRKYFTIWKDTQGLTEEDEIKREVLKLIVLQNFEQRKTQGFQTWKTKTRRQKILKESKQKQAIKTFLQYFRKR